MSTEIERKFLVNGTTWRLGDGLELSQGYLNRDQARTVRVRVAGDQGYLTIKGETKGSSRAEFEYEIPLTDAQQLLRLCDGPIIQKIRHISTYQGKKWEIDEFFGDNIGLVIAEIELQDENEQFQLPEWVGKEVTEDPRYFNSSLVSHPYSLWRDQ